MSNNNYPVKCFMCKTSFTPAEHEMFQIAVFRINANQDRRTEAIKHLGICKECLNKSEMQQICTADSKPIY